MVFSKSIPFDEQDLASVAAAAQLSHVFAPAESEFLERLRNGDADAFDNLVVRYSGEIFALLTRLTEDREEAGDLTQETFLAALKAIKSFRGDSSLKTWLFRIAVNQSRNRHRWWKRRNRDSTISIDAPVGEAERPLSETVESGGESPEEAAIASERARSLRTALGELPENFREAVVLCDIEGLTYEEISETLSVNVGTVKSRIARGREMLRKRLNDF